MKIEGKVFCIRILYADGGCKSFLRLKRLACVSSSIGGLILGRLSMIIKPVLCSLLNFSELWHNDAPSVQHLVHIVKVTLQSLLVIHCTVSIN